MPLTDEQVREWAKNEGMTVAPRGRIGAATRQLAEDAAADAADRAAEAGAAPYTGGTTEADFPPEPPDPGSNGASGTAAEAPPRRPARPPAGRQLAAWRKGKGKRKTKATRPRRPRVPVDTVVSGIWEAGARLLAPVNVPVSRVMAVQAPVAGIVLEPIVRDTVIDRILQPVARTGEGAEAVAALAGPPLIVAALQARPELAPILVPMLREVLGRWIKVAGPAVQIAADRAAQFEEEYGATVDNMMAMFFAGIPGFDPDVTDDSPGPGEAAAAAAEESAIRRAQGMPPRP